MSVGTELIGWASSMVLLLTLMGQVRRQWRSKSVEGVSWVLFAGQIAASVGFVTYSLLVDNTVFIVTNCLILATAITGQLIYLRRRHQQEAREASSAATPDAPPGR